MSHANAFRSHLMQQFVAQSSRQVRPPLALSSVVGPLRGGAGSRSGSKASSSAAVIVDSSSQPHHTKHAVENNNEKQQYRKTKETINIISADQISEEAQLFQKMLMSRRTTSNYASKSTWESSPQKLLLVREALHRAISCAIQAPNHKRTEPWTFKTLVYPSSTRQALLNLIPNDDDTPSLKRQRWENIPAFVVALVHGQPNQEEIPTTTMNTNDFTVTPMQQELTVVPPSTLRQMEDYAATCAAVQNLMLSLSSEGLASKWSTGSMTRTMSFRQLVNAKPDELVVGLIMAGFPTAAVSNSRRANAVGHSIVTSRRGKREILGDILQDL